MSRREWTLFFGKGLAIVGLIVGSVALTLRYYGLGYDPQVVTCLPYHLYIFTRTPPDPSEIQRGELITFRMDGRGKPFFGEGEQMVKKVVGIPGDHVSIHNGQVKVNGRLVKTLNDHVMHKMGKSPADFERSLTLANGEFWVMGTHPRSFDSAYWGVVHAGQIIGKILWAN